MKVIKVGFIISRINGGGREKRAINLALYLSSLSNFSTFLVTTDVDVLNKIEYFHTLGLRVFYVRKWASINFFKVIFSQGRCILHTWGFIETFYSILFRIFKYKIVNSAITGHSSGFKFSFIKNQFWSFILNLTNFTISNSRVCLESFYIKNKSNVIFNSVDSVSLDINKASIAYKFGLNLRKRHVLMVANYKSGKLFHKAIDLLKVIEGKFNDIVFVFVGKDVLMNLSTNIDQRDNLILFDQMEFKDILELQYFCDIGLLISDFEGQSNSILEFMAMSKPVVVVEGGGMKDLLQNKFNSIYYNEFDIDIISYDLIRIIEDPVFSLFISSNGYKTVRDFCNNQYISQKYIDCYCRL
jgi:glycosyltransferase involved in cell wall biosynthesis